MGACWCSLAGTAACQHCRNNPMATDVWTNKTVIVEDFQTEDVKPVVRGKWLLGGYGQVSDAAVKWYDKFLQGSFFYCSACKERSAVKTNFCPNCGAVMEKS